MSRLTDLVFRVLRIHAGDTPVKVKEAIFHPIAPSNDINLNCPEPAVEPEHIETIRPPSNQTNEGTSNLASR